MNLKFWGVRGSIPTPEADRLRYGGNTTCLEIGAPDSPEPVIIDCGSGIRALGDELLARSVRRIHILLTHFHWDHIQGLPSFAPVFQAGIEVVFYTSRSPVVGSALFSVQMADPFFPVPFCDVCSHMEFNQVECGKPFAIGSTQVEAVHLNHPQGAIGFRFESHGHVLVHASDHEAGNEEVDAGIIRAARGADVLVMDAQYTPEEYESKVGWGHSSYAHATEMAQAAQVKQLLLFHHDPGHDDKFLDQMQADAQRQFAATGMACEGRVYDV
ncbi:MAG TPA: MBL fold metallo-hydrolase [Terracidiphilus sp.]|nr:MBL fold metallo-hydrolase [Terracidiphilus sp.]